MKVMEEASKETDDELDNTKDLEIVEESPYDKIWGIGLDENDELLIFTKADGKVYRVVGAQ